MNAETAATFWEAIMGQEGCLGCMLNRMSEADAVFERSVVGDGEVKSYLAIRTSTTTECCFDYDFC